LEGGVGILGGGEPINLAETDGGGSTGGNTWFFGGDGGICLLDATFDMLCLGFGAGG
jgi:hypothetical protein|tara:strand:- start:186 stop:356 length:171 start_codon:yes stop_codon:yes gene_type:complete